MQTHLSERRGRRLRRGMEVSRRVPAQESSAQRQSRPGIAMVDHCGFLEFIAGKA